MTLLAGKKICGISSAILLLVLSSCYSPRYMYSPPASNVPVFEKRGDSKLAVGYAVNSFGSSEVNHIYNYGFDAQTAYAVNNHWLVMINQSNRYQKTGTGFRSGFGDSSSIRYKRMTTEIGAGYFTKLNDSSNITIQLTGGIGFGNFKMNEAGRDAMNTYYSRFHQTAIRKFFFQPVLQLRFNERFTSSLVSRFMVLWYLRIDTDYTATEQDNYLLDGLSSSPRTFWEPAVISNFSFKKMPAVQFEFQVGFAALISRRFIDYNSFNLSAAAILDLSKLKKKRD